MKKQFLWAALAAVTLFGSSCNNDDPNQEKQEGNEVTFVIGGIGSRTATNAETFAATFEGNETIGLFSTGLQGTQMNNTSFTVSVGDAATTLAPTESATFKFGTGTATFNAYYPLQTNTEDNTLVDETNVTFTINQDQTDDEKFNANDFMTAVKQATATNESVSLEFKHRMAFVQVELNNISDIQYVIMHSVKPTITYDATGTTEQGTVTTKDDATPVDVLMYDVLGEEGTTYWAIVPAQTITGALFTVEKTNGKTYTYTAQEGQAFGEGKIVKFSLTGDEDSKTLSQFSGVTIADWGSNDNNLIVGELAENILNLENIISNFSSGGLIPENGGTWSTGWKYNYGSAEIITEENVQLIKYTSPTSFQMNNNTEKWYNDGISYYCTEELNTASTYTLSFEIKGNSENDYWVFVGIKDGNENKIFKVTKIGNEDKTTHTVATLKTTTGYVTKTITIYPAEYTTFPATSVQTFKENTNSSLPFAIVFKAKTTSTAADGETEASNIEYYIKNISFKQDE